MVESRTQNLQIRVVWGSHGSLRVSYYGHPM